MHSRYRMGSQSKCPSANQTICMDVNWRKKRTTKTEKYTWNEEKEKKDSSTECGRIGIQPMRNYKPLIVEAIICCWHWPADQLPKEKYCYGWLHRRLLRRYRPQSAVNCSTLWERAAGSSPNTSQVGVKWPLNLMVWNACFRKRRQNAAKMPSKRSQNATKTQPKRVLESH